MATTSRGEPAKQVAIDILRHADKPLHAKEIATRVLASGRCAGLKGKTPEATIAAMLAVGSKPGGPFSRVGKGTYTLAEMAAAATPAETPSKPAAAKSARRAGTTAKTKKKATGQPRAKRPAAKPTR